MGFTAQPKEKEQTEIISSNKYVLVLHNDDHNSFDGVILALITFCDHALEQAEQVANIVHYVGKCDVKHGDKETITKIYNQLKGNGLTVTMES
jgi:ATP-dependent Clp protease adaptor protein ClpS